MNCATFRPEGDSCGLWGLPVACGHRVSDPWYILFFNGFTVYTDNDISIERLCKFLLSSIKRGALVSSTVYSCFFFNKVVRIFQNFEGRLETLCERIGLVTLTVWQWTVGGLSQDTRWTRFRVNWLSLISGRNWMFQVEWSTHLWVQVVSLFTAATMNRDLICTSSRGLRCRQSTGDRWETISLAKTSYASHRWQVIFTIFICPTFHPPWSAAWFLYCFNEQEATQRVNTSAAPPNWHLHQSWGSEPHVLPRGSLCSYLNRKVSWHICYGHTVVQ